MVLLCVGSNCRLEGGVFAYIEPNKRQVLVVQDESQRRDDPTAETDATSPESSDTPEQVQDPPPLRLQLDDVDAPRSRLQGITSRFRVDREILERYWSTRQSSARHNRFSQFLNSWLQELSKLDTADFCELTRRDYHRLMEQVYSRLAENEAEQASLIESAPLIPFRSRITDLLETKSRVEKVNPVEMAEQVVAIEQLVSQWIELLDQPSESATEDAETRSISMPVSRIKRAIDEINSLKTSLGVWFTFYESYDPQFNWWVAHPYQQAVEKLERYVNLLKDLTAGADDGSMRTFRLPSLPVDAGESRSEGPWVSREPALDDVPDLSRMMSQASSRMQPIIAEYFRGQPGRRGRARGRQGGEQARQRLQQWSTALEELDFDSLDQAERVDYLLLKNRIEYSLKRLDLGATGETVRDESGIPGRAIGREAIQLELAHEMIPYSPEELIEIANLELAWCRSELIRASNELGFGDDWRAAVEHVKSLHVNPGEQPFLVRQLSDEAVNYLRDQDLLTIPPLANETWRMQMMSPERQLVTPFFTGGEVVSVGFPTNTMSHHAKLQSLRGNNIHFSRATVHHELIPGHGLQAFMNARYRPYRSQLGTPFWTEGWALYWEMILYERGFSQTPEDRIGFLVWRSHRCARIVFSLSFHLGWMTQQQCVDFLVENVGFERLGAEGEVRRSFGGAYPPLYQAAYMLGGLQFRNLHQSIVKSGQMTDREFHDRILREGRIPVELVRAILLEEDLEPDFQTSWRFYDLE